MTGQRAGNTLAGLACLCEASDWPPAGTTRRQQDVLSSRPTSSTYCIWALRLTATRLWETNSHCSPTRQMFRHKLVIGKGWEKIFHTWETSLTSSVKEYERMKVPDILPLKCASYLYTKRISAFVLKSWLFSSYQFVQFPIHQLHH